MVHPGYGNYTGTLVNALAYHFENLPMNSSERPGLVHRIDKDTSGLLLVAKNENAKPNCVFVNPCNTKSGMAKAKFFLTK